MSTPTLTELAAPVLLMAECFIGHQASMGQYGASRESTHALVAFKRALKEAEAPTPTAHDALIAEARERLQHPRRNDTCEHINFIGRLADALTTEPYRHALEQRLIGSNLPGLTGDADADLMRFVLHEQEIAGYFCGQLEKDLTAERAARVAAEKASIGCLSERDLWCREARAAYDRRDAAIARAERAERERDAEKASHFNSLTKWAAERDTLRQQLAEAREELEAPESAQARVKELTLLNDELLARNQALITAMRELNQVNEKLERELAGLGPVEYVVNTDAHGWRLTHCAEYEHVRSLIPDNALAIRRVLPAKEASNA